MCRQGWATWPDYLNLYFWNVLHEVFPTFSMACFFWNAVELLGLARFLHHFKCWILIIFIGKCFSAAKKFLRHTASIVLEKAYFQLSQSKCVVGTLHKGLWKLDQRYKPEEKSVALLWVKDCCKETLLPFYSCFIKYQPVIISLLGLWYLLASFKYWNSS